MKNLNGMNLMELSSIERQCIQGGGTTEYYHDSQGYTWMYSYDDGGELTRVCVVQAMIVK